MENILIKNAIEVNKNYDINNLKKIKITQDINNTIDKLFSELKKIEKNINTSPNFCFVIFLINENDNNNTYNKIISTITFILLNGNELLNKNNLSKKKKFPLL